MLEERIKTLDAHVAELTAAVERLTAALGDTTPPATPAKAKPAKTRKTTSAKAKTTLAEEPAQAVTEPVAWEAPTLTIEDVRRALVDLVTREGQNGRAAALDVLKGFSARKVGDLAPERYPEVIAAAERYGQKEAA